MSSKSLIWIGLFAGSAVGGMIPSLWGDNFMTLSSVIFTAIGAFIGIWIGFKLGQ